MTKLTALAGILVIVAGCAGADGKDGADGEQGPQGQRGADGEQGPQGLRGQDGADGADGAAAQDIITAEVLCQANDGTSFLSAYIWVMADGDAVGICSVGEGAYSETSPIINRGCNLVSPGTTSVISINFNTNPPTISGGLVGTMACL